MSSRSWEDTDEGVKSDAMVGLSELALGDELGIRGTRSVADSNQSRQPRCSSSNQELPIVKPYCSKTL